VRAGRMAALVAARDPVPFPAGGARRRERRPPSHRARRVGEMFPSGQSQGEHRRSRLPGQPASGGKISAARRSWRPVDGQAERGTLSRAGKKDSALLPSPRVRPSETALSGIEDDEAQESRPPAGGDRRRRELRLPGASAGLP
jgi:hypothetical protein